MSDTGRTKSSSERWAEFRFGVVGQLLSSPPARGSLRAALRELSDRTWKHPVTGEPARYGVATIERWYYCSLRERGSVVQALQRKSRADIGKSRVLDDAVKTLLRAQHREHSSWSYRLHADNMAVELESRGMAVPSREAVRRWMQNCGLFKTSRCRGQNRQGAIAARDRAAAREVRSYENEYVCGLWHLDFHHCSRQILLRAGKWQTPICVAVLDDHSRLACHVQWYLHETAENLVHGFSQAVQKRGLPRALLSDNGSAMVSAEFTEGLLALGIVGETTLPYSPYQNGKQERFFGILEGRLIAMLESCAELSLAELNDATCSWVEMEYNRTLHEEIGEAPLTRFLQGKSVSRPSPSSEALRLAFRRVVSRRQRRTDGTVSLEGKRFELPERYRHMQEVRVRYATWDLSLVHLVDPQTGVLLCPLYPLDKTSNASAMRREVLPRDEVLSPPTGGIAPLLKKLMADYAATGLPPAYLPKPEDEENS